MKNRHLLYHIPTHANTSCLDPGNKCQKTKFFGWNTKNLPTYYIWKWILICSHYLINSYFEYVIVWRQISGSKILAAAFNFFKNITNKWAYLNRQINQCLVFCWFAPETLFDTESEKWIEINAEMVSYLGYFCISYEKITFYTDILTGKVELRLFSLISLEKKHRKTNFLILKYQCRK